ncbi:MAG: tetratricopeptide repeat protein [Candidatus Sericytochromatia bacterium]
MEPYKRAELVEKILSLDKDSALELAKIIYDKYKADFKNSEYLDEFLEIANDYDRFGEYEKALNIYLKAEKRALILDSKEHLAPIYAGMGIVYNYLKEYDSSLRSYEKAINLFKELNNEQEIGILYNNMGFVYKNILKFQESIRSYINAIEIFRKIDDKFSMSAAYFNIADIFKYLKDYETSLKYIEKCIDIDIDLKLESLDDDIDYKNELLRKLGRAKKEDLKKDKKEENVFLDDEDDEDINKKPEGNRWNWLWKKK